MTFHTESVKKKLFLSSTCYDSGARRESIETWATAQGYIPMLSDRASFPVDPGIHRHDVCLANAKTSDLFVLLVGGRFGAPYYQDETISVTWAEYRAAAFHLITSPITDGEFGRGRALGCVPWRRVPFWCEAG